MLINMRETSIHFRLRLVAMAIAVSGFVPTVARAEALHEVIDREIERHAPGPLAERCDDATFLRRITLDLTGRIPSAEDAQRFLSDTTETKRIQWIDGLLASDQYPHRMQEAFTAMLLERRTDNKVPNPQWEQFLRQSFAENRPWNELVGQLLFSEPAADKNPTPPEKFFLVSGRNDLHQKTQDVARLMLGRDIMCAQCHDHPTVGDFSQADYYGLFSYLQETADKARSKYESVFVPGKQSTGPRLPGGEEVQIPELEKGNAEQARKHQPRRLLADDLTDSSSRLFVRNSVNRLWYLMMGRGLVHPLDMLHSGNPPSHPALLETLADSFIASNFDVKRLLREIALSRAYQRSGRLPADVKPADTPPESYVAAIPKPLSPEQMAWTVMQATGQLERLSQAPPALEASKFTYKDYINGRIDTLPDNVADVMTLFIGVFANPPGEAEVEFNPAMGHALFLMNEKLVLDWLKPQPGNLVDRLAGFSAPDEIAEHLYLSVLTRRPTAEEIAEVAWYLDRFPEARRATTLGELAWALIASTEFRVNH